MFYERIGGKVHAVDMDYRGGILDDGHDGETAGDNGH